MEELVDGLDPDDELLAERLAAGATHAQAAEASGISTKTVQRRMQTPEFAAVVSRLRRERVAEITSRLVSLSDDAVGVLGGLLGASEAGVRLQAVRVILSSSRSYYREMVLEQELLQRIEDLEQTFETTSTKTKGVSDV